jgi:hypothetical protein
MDRLRTWWLDLRRWIRERLHAMRYAVDPDRRWHFPDRYKMKHVVAFNELLADVGFAQAYDEAEAEESSPAGPVSAIEQAIGQAADTGTVSTAKAREIRLRLMQEDNLRRLHEIIFDLRGRDPMEVPVDVSIEVIQHFMVAYVRFAAGLTGMRGATGST